VRNWRRGGWLLTLVLIVFLVGGCSSGFLVPPWEEDGTSDWTVMVFLNGDNDLNQAAWRDLNSMEEVGSTDRVNIIVQFDSYFGEASRYRVERDYDPYRVTSPVLQNLGEVNMGDPGVLSDFIRFCAQHFPAEKYLLVIWNHGSGFKGITRDISFDDTSGDALTIPQVAEALTAGYHYLGKKIDLLGMDACLMAMVEVVYQIEGYAQIFVSSQELEPEEGWDYRTLLRALVQTPSIGERELARIIVDSYTTSYPYGSVTQSAVDLGKVATLVQAVDRLSQRILADSLTPPGYYLELGDSAQYFSGDWDYVDLAHLAALIGSDPGVSSQVRVAAQEVQAAVEETVFYYKNRGVEVEAARGLSIYFPWYPYNSKYDSLRFARDTQWDEMIRYLARWR